MAVPKALVILETVIGNNTWNFGNKNIGKIDIVKIDEKMDRINLPKW